MTETVLVVAVLFALGLSAWEWWAFWVLDPRATRSALVRSGNPFGYRTRAITDTEVLVRPVTRFEPGPSAAPFLFALAKVTAPKETAQLTGYLPAGPLAFMALIVLASVLGGNGSAICFARLKRLADAGPPIPLSVTEEEGILPR